MPKKFINKTKNRNGKRIDISIIKEDGNFTRTKTVSKDGKILKRKTISGSGGYPDAEAIAANAPNGVTQNVPRDNFVPQQTERGGVNKIVPSKRSQTK